MQHFAGEFLKGLLSILTGIEFIFRGVSTLYLYGPLLFVAYGVFWIVRNWWQYRDLISSPDLPEPSVATLPGLQRPIEPRELVPRLSLVEQPEAVWLGSLDAKLGVLINIMNMHGMPLEHGPTYYEWNGAPVLDFGFSAWTISITSRRWVLLPGTSFRKHCPMSRRAFSEKFLGELPSTNLDVAAMTTEIGSFGDMAAIRLVSGGWIVEPGMGAWRRANPWEKISPMERDEFDQRYLALPLVDQSMLSQGEQYFMHRRELEFFNWEGRAAVVELGEAVVRRRGDLHWSRADSFEVLDSGRPITMVDLEAIFSPLAPLPRWRLRA